MPRYKVMLTLRTPYGKKYTFMRLKFVFCCERMKTILTIKITISLNNAGSF